MIRVTLDTSALFVTRAGVARHIHGLLSGVRELARPDLTISQFAWEVENHEFAQPWRSLKTVYRDLIWRCLIAPWQLRADPPDLFHSPAGGYVRPPRRFPWVVTLHDLAMFRFPLRYRRWHRLIGRKLTRIAAEADRIICISQFTADEAIRLLEIPHHKLEVVHNGCDFVLGCPASLSDDLGIDVPAEFFLFVGSLEPGKNLALLREVYEQAAERGVRLPPLLIVGARWVGVPGEGKPPSDWHYLGRQPDSVLAALYRRAIALTFPSVYEGFGLPVAEAMALGCPVICGPVASLPEVGGSAPVYVSLHAEHWLPALVEMSRNEYRRQECIAAGLQQARRFSWRRCAEHTVSVYAGMITT